MMFAVHVEIAMIIALLVKIIKRYLALIVLPVRTLKHTF